MLKSITKKYSDESDMKLFQFTFYCDCCGKGIKATPLEFHSMFSKKPFLTSDEREARAIIYANEHRQAYERANNEIMIELNRCEICSAVVCDDCAYYLDELGGGICCTKCAGEKKRGNNNGIV